VADQLAGEVLHPGREIRRLADERDRPHGLARLIGHQGGTDPGLRNWFGSADEIDKDRLDLRIGV
jgi:hypothetical protein